LADPGALDLLLRTKLRDLTAVRGAFFRCLGSKLSGRFLSGRRPNNGVWPYRGHHSFGVHRDKTVTYLKVNVRTRRASGVSRIGEKLPPRYLLTCTNLELRVVSVEGRDPIAMLHDHHLTIPADTLISVGDFSI
jgi:hypothetical protein